MLKFKKRSQKQNLKKVLIYGFDGTGKSTFAYDYCQKNNLNAVVIDIDDTNYTDLPLVEFNRTTDTAIYESLKRIIKELKDEEKFDTIIIDGVSSLLELLVSNGRGMNKYGDRTARWNKLLNLLLNTGKHLIFIGQIDMLVIEGESSKAVINVNSIINEKYRCIIENGKYSHIVEKYRVLEKSSNNDEPAPANQQFQTADNVEQQKTEARIQAEKFIEYLKKRNKSLNMFEVKLEMANCHKKGHYSLEECVEIIKELEVLLNG